jgi:hypothetical protein
MSVATSYDSILESHKFPNVVGCEEFRAKALVRYWLKVKTGIEHVKFRLFDHTQKNKLTRPAKDSFGNDLSAPVSQHSNEVILWYDYKYDAVAITPYWFGSVQYAKYSEEEILEQERIQDEEDRLHEEYKRHYSMKH